jgi:predicted metalloprotease with PDZ domain
MFTTGLLAAMVVSACLGSGAAEAAPRRLAYQIRPVKTEGGVELEVEVRFPGEASGTTVVQLPSEFGPVRDLESAVVAIEPLDPSVTLADGEAPHLKRLEHPRGVQVALRYRMRMDWSGDLSEDPTRYYRPVITPEYVHLIGWGLFVRPDWGDRAMVEASVRWVDVPESWALCSSFGDGPEPEPGVRPLGELLASLYVGGDFRVSRIEVRGKPVSVAVRGEWLFEDAAFVAAVARIIEVERAFWDDDDFPHYLISLLPGLQRGSTSGTGLTQSFAMASSPETEMDERLLFVLAHEHFHTWNSPKLGRFPEPEAATYWLSEGFTDYYAHLMLLRAGLIDLDGYVKGLNDDLRELCLSPAREVPNGVVVGKFFADREVGKLPYRRGRFLAMRWDAALRGATGGKITLDDVMTSLRDGAKGDPERELTREVILAALRPHLGEAAGEDIRVFIDEGKLPEPTAGWLGPCGRLSVKTQGRYELGFDFEALRETREIRGVVDGSAAHRAGLRDGHKLAGGVSLSFNDVSTPVTLKVRPAEGGETIEVSYLPQSAETVDVPQWEIDREVLTRDPEGCRGWFGLGR